MALRRSDSGVAAATPELVHLYLNGSGDEKRRAEEILLRIGDASHVHLRKFDDVRGKENLARFQRLQRLLGFEEKQVRHIELVRIGDTNLIKAYVAIAELLDAVGPIGFKRLAVVADDAAKVGDFPDAVSRSEQSLLRVVTKFTDKLNIVCEAQDPIELVSRNSGLASDLTDEGRDWLVRCNSFLIAIEN